MSNLLTDRAYLLTKQYRNASNLNARIRLHARFSSNQYGWMPWVFDQLDLSPDSHILELGCGSGDLWLENFIVKDQRLAGVIDFANASFSDPVYEFLLSFFVAPELGGRGIEARYCRRMGYDPAMLPWYHGLEYFDTLRWVLTTGENFVHHTKESLEADLRVWLDQRSG